MVRALPAIFVVLFACGHGGGDGGGDDDGPNPTADARTGDAAEQGTCGTCDDPPTDCHERIGSCVDGVCQYAFVDNAPCDDGNACTVGDTCGNGACAGTPLVCESPPGNVCISGSQLKAYDQVGACVGGLCTYGSQTVACGTGGCSGGACATDPCANVVCNTPPSGCFAATGTCNNGSCTYPYANGAACNDSNACTNNDACSSGVCVGAPKACNTPPPNVCEDAATVKIYGPVGSCSLGNCSYSYGFATCASGCANGQCNATGWVVMNSNVTIDLETVWAASATSVWVGGTGGTLVYYNGAQWQARSSGTVYDIMEIHGTAANNVFALAGNNRLLHFDGSSWSTAVTTLPTYYTYAIFAIGTKDVLAYGTTTSTTTGGHTLARVKHNGATWETTTLKSGTEFRGANYGYRIWADSASSVYLPGGNFWNGSMVSHLGQATYFGRAPGRMWKSGSLILGQDWQNGDTIMYSLEGNTWTPMATGFAGTIEDFYGPSANRVFAVGYTTSAVGHVLYFDGLGWTSPQLPMGVPRLRGVWALATGEVFAVGNAGTIIRGP